MSKTESSDKNISDWIEHGITKSELEYTNKNKPNPSLQELIYKNTESSPSNSRNYYSDSDIIQFQQYQNTKILVDKSIQTDPENGHKLQETKYYFTKGQSSSTSSNSVKSLSSSSKNPMILKDNSSSTFSSNSSNNHQILSPTCSLLNHCVKKDLSIASKDLQQIIKTHREEHIKNVKEQLAQLRLLNKFIEDGRESEPKTRRRAVGKALKTLKDNNVSKLCINQRDAHVDSKLDKIIESVNNLIDHILPTNTNTQQDIHYSQPEHVQINQVMKTDSSVQSNQRIRIENNPCKENLPEGIAYFLPITPVNHVLKQRKLIHNENKENEQDEDTTNEISNQLEQLNLQEILKRNNGEFLRKAKERAKIIADIKAARSKRQKLKKEWIDVHGPLNLSYLEKFLPPKSKGLMTTREMKNQTQKTYKKLPEVQQKKLNLRKEMERESNRLLSNRFSQKLRVSALKGNVNVGLNSTIGNHY